MILTEKCSALCGLRDPMKNNICRRVVDRCVSPIVFHAGCVAYENGFVSEDIVSCRLRTKQLPSKGVDNPCA
jgi:hypothetical protein